MALVSSAVQTEQKLLQTQQGQFLKYLYSPLISPALLL